MNRKGIEFTLLLIEPGLWKWRFQIGEISSRAKPKRASWAWPRAGLSSGLTAN
jgi:hypothetical protein